MRSTARGLRKSKALFVLTVSAVLLGLVVVTNELTVSETVESASTCVANEYVQCWSADLSTTSKEEEIDSLCKDIAAARNICEPSRHVVFLAARNKNLEGYPPNQKNYFCDFEDRLRTNKPPTIEGSTEKVKFMASNLCKPSKAQELSK